MAGLHGVSLPTARLMLVLEKASEPWRSYSLMVREKHKASFDIEWYKRMIPFDFTYDDIPNSLTECWLGFTGQSKKSQPVTVWRDLFFQQKAKMQSQVEDYLELRRQCEEWLVEYDERIEQLERENAKYRVVLQELGIDPDGIPDLPVSEFLESGIDKGFIV